MRPLAPSADMVIELVRMQTAQQYPMLMPTLSPGELATKERPYCTLASMWTVFANLKHNTTLAINGDKLTSASQASSSQAPVHRTSSGPTGPRIRRPGRPSAHGVASVSPIHSRRDLFSVDYDLWPFDDKDNNTVFIVTNLVVNTDLSLWTQLLTEEARRQACIQYRGRCCNCGSTDHSLRWCPAPFKNVFSILNQEFATHDPDGSTSETWKRRMRNWLRKGSQRRYQGFLRRFFRA